MVYIKERSIEHSSQPFSKPMIIKQEERDVSGLKDMLNTANDFVVNTGLKYPYLTHVNNRSLFIQKIQEAGCTLPERSIDRAIRSAVPFFESQGIDTGRYKEATMEADHRIVYGGMKV